MTESAIRASIGLSIKSWRHKSTQGISLPFVYFPFHPHQVSLEEKTILIEHIFSILLQTTEIEIAKVQLLSNEW